MKTLWFLMAGVSCVVAIAAIVCICTFERQTRRVEAMLKASAARVRKDLRR